MQGATAGLHLLITFPGSLGEIDDEAVATQLRTRVLAHPLSVHRQRPGPPGLVLGYASLTRQLRDAAAAHRRGARTVHSSARPLSGLANSRPG